MTVRQLKAQYEAEKHKREHGIREVLFDNLAGGWRLTCLCGWQSDPCLLMRVVGEEFDEHLLETVPGTQAAMEHEAEELGL